MVRRLLLSAAVLASCAEVVVDVRERPCVDGVCIDGYVCHPMRDRCVPRIAVGCNGAGVCPSAVAAGGECDEVGSFIPCTDAGVGCDSGCRTCLEAHTWSACIYDECEIATVGACGDCDDDCRASVSHALPRCDLTATAPMCAYHDPCHAGWADGDGLAANGCECPVDCVDRCGGDDGCGGTCADTCAPPETCGGGGAAGECGCTVECSGRCAGGDGCGGTCPDNCIAPASCGALVANACGCDPACGDRCSGVDACGGECPDLCVAPLTCGGGQEVDACGCTPTCGERCAGPDGCGGSCPDMCVVPAFCDTDQLCSCVADCAGRCAGDDGCGGQCPDDCVGPESCGGGDVADVCGWWWSCRYPERRQLTVTADGQAVGADYSVSVTFNHQLLVSAGRSRASGDDVRVVWWNGGDWVELDRVVDPASDWNAPNTVVWFALRAALGAAASDDGYFLYWGDTNPDVPPADENAVFHFADFFDRANALDVGNAWSVYPGASGSVIIDSEELWFATSGNQADRPVVFHDFGALAGLVEWRIGFDWARPGASGTDPTYWVTMQLGDSAVMEITPSTFDWYHGAGPDLVWGGDTPQSVQESLFYGTGDGGGEGGWTLSGAHELRMAVDVDVDTFDLWIDGTLRQTDAPFSSARTVLDRVRFMCNGVNDGGSARGYDFVIVRPMVDFDPVVAGGVEEASDCP